jgi:hypothetical protein
MRHRQRGQAMALVAVLLPAVVVGLGLVVDTALVFRAHRDALALADAAAQYGAAQIDQVARRAHPGEPAPINVPAAESMARDYVLFHRPDAIVQASATRQIVNVNISIETPTILWHLPGHNTVRIQAQGNAQPFTGVATGQAP